MKNLNLLTLTITSVILAESTQSLETMARLYFYKEDGKTVLNVANGFPDRLVIHLSFSGGNVFLELLRNNHLFSKDYKDIRSKGNETKETKINEADLLCYYHGHVVNGNGNDDNVVNVALSLCDGLRGSFVMNESWFEMRPESNHYNSYNYVYLKKEKNDLKYSCGFDSNRKIKANPNKKRKRRSIIMDRRIKIVEIYAGIDATIIAAKNGDRNAAIQRCREIVNLANLYFQGLDIYLVMVGSVMIEEGVTAASSTRVYLDNWMNYRLGKIHEWPKHDLGLLLTKRTFGPVVGTALENVMCKLSSSVAFIVDVEQTSISSATMAHEIGHSFGVLHDEDYKDCSCPKEACVLETSIKNIDDFGWSDCSVSMIVALFETGTDICLYNPVTLTGHSVCGDGIVDGREQCDCGRLPKQLCNPECCEKAMCKFVSGKGCSQGSCCDIPKCKLKKSGDICRSSKEECDSVEKCDGSSSECPQDKFAANGAMCTGENYCYEGKCITKDKACSILYGTRVKASPDNCYTKNTEGSIGYNCGYDARNFSKPVPCSSENAMCGSLNCDAREDILKSVFKRYKSMQASGTVVAFCSVISFDVYFGVPDLGMVPNGARCGATKLCLDRNCIERSVFISRTNSRTERLSRGGSLFKWWQHVKIISIIIFIQTIYTQIN